jgi:hypothetical protein
MSGVLHAIFESFWIVEDAQRSRDSVIALYGNARARKCAPENRRGGETPAAFFD